MHGPESAAWLLVALCAVTGASCLLRRRSGDGEQRRTAGGEALMGFGMALMAVPAAVVTPPRWTWLLYAAVFGGAALRALWAARRGAHHLHHLAGTFAMAYMSLAMAARPSGHAHHAAAGLPVLTGVLLVYFTGYVLRAGVRLVPAGAPVSSGTSVGAASGTGAGTAGPAWRDRPELARACRLSMAIGMLAMLLTM
ncbi:DUF5134 domain-containing protein [Streptomyces sp. SID5785]|uniref:DUF5134 domain-containing protein n=1 Tax=Streptomyces sp. SID5785 TaxID=2690309 RepID=UPI001361EE1D|nr:DUF5134 domain-containing protein [Streptomyces sp. SID5785]